MNEIVLTAEHRYFVDGVSRPSVTQILLEAGLIDVSRYEEYYRERGTKAHRAIGFLLEGELDMTTVDPAIAGYVTAASRAICDLQMVPRHIERSLYSPIFSFCGTPDVYGPRRAGDEMLLIDWKTGSIEPWAALQLAGYSQLILENEPEFAPLVERRMAIKLSDDGTYRIYPFDDVYDRDVFLATSAVRNWKANKNKMSGKIPMFN